MSYSVGNKVFLYNSLCNFKFQNCYCLLVSILDIVAYHTTDPKYGRMSMSKSKGDLENKKIVIMFLSGSMLNQLCSHRHYLVKFLSNFLEIIVNIKYYCTR